MSDVDFVRIQFDATQRLKLKFRHKDLRDAVLESGKAIGELYSDPFGGWPFLLKYAMRAYDLKVTTDKASEYIEIWVRQPDPNTNEKRTLDQLGQVLLEALNVSGFVSIKADEQSEAEAEGNATPEAVTR